MSFIDAGYEILKREGKSLTAEEITTIALNQGLISTTGKTPSATMGAQLYMDIKKNADISRFVKVDRGKFGLREWSTTHAGPAPPFRSLSFKDAAYTVLKEGNRPLRIEDITEIALEKGILKTTGKTPVATMGAQLYTNVKTSKD
ncbi:MAG: winged helix-turn-helix domain-containing protein, partial [Chloroflexota bacterium]|nr:winged helix-turn-helix domain-containing protein [Chloroflexota bacterium]